MPKEAHLYHSNTHFNYSNSGSNGTKRKHELIADQIIFPTSNTLDVSDSSKFYQHKRQAEDTAVNVAGYKSKRRKMAKNSSSPSTEGDYKLVQHEVPMFDPQND